MSQFFIDRPRFAWVVGIIICLLGLLSIRSLGVSQYPNVAPPQIEISANYPGASALTVNDTVTGPIEEELNGAKHLLYYDSSSSSSGTADITVTFEPGTSPDLAQVDVQNLIKRVEGRLPQAVLRQGITVTQTGASMLLMFALSYKPDGRGNAERDPVGLADYAARYLNNEIRRVPGVGKVRMFSGERAMRIWIDPVKLSAYGLSAEDVNQAIASQHLRIPAGSMGAMPTTGQQMFTAPLLVSGQLSRPDEFDRIVLRSPLNGAAVRLADVARTEIGSDSYDYSTRLDGKPTVAVGVYLAPGANALATTRLVKNKLAAMGNAFPADIGYSVPYDTSRFVELAIKKVVQTLLEAIVLVFLVMWLFLQKLRYTLIPTVVVPICLLGSFAAMQALGFTINMMTLFGLVLAIGIVVDDAIIVVESVERLMTAEGLTPKAAARKAMRQISGAIMGITLVLAAVFAPLAVMSGSVGVIYRQFAMSLTVSIALSGFLALTLTPALCATLLKPVAADPLVGAGRHEQGKGFFGWFNRRFDRFASAYQRLSGRLVHRAGRTMIVYLALVAGLAVLYLRLPAAFLPVEDQGELIADIQLPAGATTQRTVRTLSKLESYLASRPALRSVVAVTGWSFAGTGQNAAIAFPVLKDWSERSKSQSAGAEAAAANKHFARMEDGRVRVVTPPPIPNLGTTGGFAMRLEDRAGVGYAVLRAARDVLLARANASKVLAYASVEGLDDVPQVRLEIDRDKAQAMGVSMAAVSEALSTNYSARQIGDFTNHGRMQRVIVQGDSQARMTPASLQRIFVMSRHGGTVPLDAFATVAWEHGPAELKRYNGYSSFSISGDAAPGYSSGEAMAEMARLASDLPPGIGYEWTGLSFQEQTAGAQAPLLMALALVMVFLVLVALYESWSVPVSVLLIVPIGALGAVCAVTLMGMPNDVYFKVGLVAIIGLSAKNAILIVEFATTLHDAGKPLREAVLEAGRLRFRPIVMTSVAFILGVLPLALAQGAGAASQHSIGIGVVGGMLGATVLGIFFVPVFFVWVMSWLGSGRHAASSAIAGTAVRRGDTGDE